MAFEKYILPDEGIKKMPIHLFVGLLSEYLAGNKDAAETKSAIESVIGESLTTDEAQDITDTITYINNGSDAFEKRSRMDEVYRVCVIAEHGVWYNTQSLLRTRLNWSTPS